MGKTWEKQPIKKHDHTSHQMPNLNVKYINNFFVCSTISESIIPFRVGLLCLVGKTTQE